MNRRDLWISTIAIYASQSFLSAFYLYPAVLIAQGYSLVETGWIMSVFFMSTTSARPLGSLIIEKKGVRFALLASSVALTFFSLFLVMANSFRMLLCVRLLQGIAYGIFMVGMTAYQALVVPPEERGTAFAAISVGYVLPQMTVVPLGDWVFRGGHPVAFLILIPMLALACLVSGLFVSDLPAGKVPKGRWGSWSDLFEVKAMLPLFLSTFFFALVNASVLQYMPAFSATKGLAASLFIVGVSIVALLVRVFGTQLLDTFPKRMLLMGFSISVMSFFGLAGLWMSHPLPLFVCGLFYGVGMGLGFPVMLALIPDVIPSRLRPKGVALAFFGMDLGWIVAPLMVGYLGALWGLGRALMPINLAGLLGGVLLYRWGWRPLLSAATREHA